MLDVLRVLWIKVAWRQLLLLGVRLVIDLIPRNLPVWLRLVDLLDRGDLLREGILSGRVKFFAVLA